MVRQLLARGAQDIQGIAAVVRTHPAMARELMAFLQAVGGNAFAQQVMRAVNPGAAAPPGGPAAPGAPPTETHAPAPAPEHIAAAAVTTPTPAPATAAPAAEPTGPMRVTASALRVRKTPSSSNDDNIVGVIKHHDVVKAEAHDGAWVQIEFEGQKAYVHSHYVEAVEQHHEDKHVAAAGPGAPAPHETKAPAPAPIAPPVAAIVKPDHAPAPHETKAPPVAPAPAPVAAHAPTPASTGAPTAAGPTAVAAKAPTPAPTAAAPGSAATEKTYHLAGLPTVRVFIPPGGVKGKTDLFMFFHGMFAHHDAKSKDVDDPEREAHMAQATAQSNRNMIAISPAAEMTTGEWPLWSALAKNKGFQKLAEHTLQQLSADLGLDPPLSMGVVSLAGHSAGGSALGEAAIQLGDHVNDVTLQDAGYTSPAFLQAHADLLKWFVSGETAKTIRVVTHGDPAKVNEGNVLAKYLNAEDIKKAAGTVKGMEAAYEPGDSEERSVGGMHLHHRVRVTGLPGTRLLSVFNFKGENHYQVRNKTMGNLIDEGPDTDFVNTAMGGQHAQHAQAPAPGGTQQPQQPVAAHAPTPQQPAPHAPVPQAPVAAHAPVNTPTVTPPTAPAHDAKTPVANAPAPKPVAPPTPAPAAKTPAPVANNAPNAPANANLTGDLSNLDALVAAAHDAKVTAVATDFKNLVATAKPLETPKATDGNELKAAGRADVVSGIKKVHGEIAALTNVEVEPAKLTEIKSIMFRTLQEISPYHSQGRNVDILENNASVHEGGLVTRTCNVTSLSMALEGLGRSPSDYTGNRDNIAKIAAAFKGPLKAAELKGDAGAGDWGQVAGLRMSDFMELAAINEVLGEREATAENIHNAAHSAFDQILVMSFLQKLGTKFGVTAEYKVFSFDGAQTHTVTNKRGKQVEQSGRVEADELGSASKDQRHVVDKLIDLRNAYEAAEAAGDTKKAAKAQKDYEAQRLKAETALHGKTIEKEVPIESYKKAVKEQLGGELASGAAIETHVTQHFVRLHAIFDDHVVIDDPSQAARAHKKVLWEEARAQGMFDKRLVFRG